MGRSKGSPPGRAGSHGWATAGRAATLAMVVATIAAGCGGSTGTEPAADDTTAATRATEAGTTPVETTTTAAPTTTPTSPATAAPIAGCDTVPLPASAEVSEVFEMDVDGDGALDSVSVYFDSDSPHFGLHAEYATGGSTLLERPVYAGQQPIVPIGVFDVNDDGIDELFLVEYVGDAGLSYQPGSFTSIVVAELGECSIESEGPFPGRGLILTVGRYPPQGVQLVCEDDRMVTYDYYQDSGSDPGAFRVTAYPYEYTDGTWQMGDPENLEVAKDEMAARPLLDCGDLELPPERPGS